MAHYSPWLHYTTDKDSGFERVRVDVAQTGFFEGREFRAYKELNIAASSTYVIKAVVPINLILNSVQPVVESGHLRLATAVGGTEGGTFTALPTIFARNNMSAGKDHRYDYPGIYTRQVTIFEGGTHTGGTELDVVRLKVAANANFAGLASVEEDAPRGVAANTYYFRLQNLSTTDAITGTFKVEWEERP